jgi:cation:H+ antiporter
MPPAIWAVIGLSVLVVGAYILVEGASRIAYAFGVSELVVGLTIVAIGTSTPELAISITSALHQRAGQIDNSTELIIGNVVGSNIANIGLILGLSAFIAAIHVPKIILQRDLLWLFGATSLVGLFAWDGRFAPVEGYVLLVGLVAFGIFQYRLAVQESRTHIESGHHIIKRTKLELAKDGGFIILGIGALAVGSDWLVDGATKIALDLGVSQFLIGLTLVAVGTSLPELATSIVGSYRGEGDIILGNIIGSNIFNLLLILAAGMVITPLEIPHQVREIQIPLMLSLTFALYPLIRMNHKITRLEGIILLAAYLFIMVMAL